MRPKLLAENPEIKVTEVAKKCGELWGGLEDSDKTEYVAAADVDKLRYEAEMVDYVPTEAPPPKPEPEKKKKKKKGPTKKELQVGSMACCDGLRLLCMLILWWLQRLHMLIVRQSCNMRTVTPSTIAGLEERGGAATHDADVRRNHRC